MRIGILTVFGGEGRARELALQSQLARALASSGQDVVEGERLLEQESDAIADAELIARADCDGLVLVVDGPESPVLAQQIAIRAQTSTLLLGRFETAYFDPANALQEGSIPFDRLLWQENPNELAAQIVAWLEQHSKAVRQRGLAAAQHLYTQRFGQFVERTAIVDDAQWLEQFGVSVKRYELGAVHEWMDRVEVERVEALREWLRIPDDGRRDSEMQLYIALRDICAGEHIHFCSVPEFIDGIPTALSRSLLNDIVDAEGDKASFVCAGDADANAALTMQILSLITNREPVPSAQLGALEPKSNRFVLNLTDGGFPRSLSPVFPDVTFARITRRSRRFVCVIARGSLPEPTKPNPIQGMLGRAPAKPKPVAELHCAPNRLFHALSTSHVHVIPGNHVGALRAACDALDIEPIVLTD